jgi:hypothetical protein
MGFISVGLISIHRVGYFDPISPPPMTFLRDPSLHDPSLCDPSWRLRYLSGIATEWRRPQTCAGHRASVHGMFLPATRASATLL